MHRRTFLMFLVALAAAPAMAEDAQPTFCDLASDPAAVDRLLAQLQDRYPDFDSRLRAIVLLRIGTPYVLGCLGEEAPPDLKPIFRLDQSDCTVNVLTCCALAHAHTYEQARLMMTHLNYYPGPDPIRYENRIHFTEDRLQTNPYFRMVETSAPQQTVTVVLNRKADGTRLLDIPWAKQVTLHYISLADVTPAVLDQLPPLVAGVAFVRKQLFDTGQAIGHEGFVVDRRWLVHADSILKRTTRIELLEYLRLKAEHFDGVVFSQLM